MSIRLLRSLDGIFYALLVFIVFLLYEASGVIMLHGAPTLFTILPVAALFVATLYLPVYETMPPNVRRSMLRLKLCSLGVLGFYPFVPWHLHGAESVYLTVSAGIGLVLGGFYVIQLLRILDPILAAGGKDHASKASVHVRQALGYLYVTPVLTVYTFLIYHMVKQHTTPARLLEYAWESLNPGLRAGIAVVLSAYTLAALFVIWNARICVRLHIQKRENVSA